MMQGDAYSQPVTLLREDGTPIYPADVADVEITIGFLSKTYAKGEVKYDENRELWLFPLNQEETFAFPASKVKAQARIKMSDGTVEGVDLGYTNVHESSSKEVL